jgi:hypothetical protein
MSALTEVPEAVESGLRRRDVLGLGALAGAGQYLTGWGVASALGLGGGLGLAPEAEAALSGASVSTASLPDRWMSVGYLDGSDDYRSVRHFPWKLSGGSGRVYSVSPAADMAIGDQSLVNEEITVTILGLYPRLPPNKQLSFAAATLVVWMPSEDPLAPGSWPVLAWSARRGSQRNRGQRVSFPVPVLADGLVEVMLETIWNPVRAGEPRLEQRYVTRLTADWLDGLPRLRRGIYLLGLGPTTWQRGTRLPRVNEAVRDDLCSLAISIESPRRG